MEGESGRRGAPAWKVDPIMRCHHLALSLLLALSVAGCGTFSMVSHGAGRSPAINENARVEHVPQPGFTEHITVVLYPTGIPVVRRATSRSTRTRRSAGQPRVVAAQPPELRDPVLACKVSQTGNNINYIAATHYGKRWKLVTGLAFVAEAAIAAVYLLTDAKDGESNVPRRIAGGLIGIDALVTGGLFFVPKRDVLQTKHRVVTTLVRRDCPAGVALEVDGTRVSVDGAGKLAPLGPELVHRMMTNPAGRLALRVGDRTAEVLVSPAQRCSWLRARRMHQEANQVCAQGAMGMLGPITATLQVAPGMLSASR